MLDGSSEFSHSLDPKPTLVELWRRHIYSLNFRCYHHIRCFPGVRTLWIQTPRSPP
jgi:hypothetical protein